MDKIFFIDKSSSKPLYIQIYQSVIQEINQGKLQGDEKMPSILQLASQMGLSKITIENAYAQLVAEGYLYAQPQKGYFVTPMKAIAAQQTQPQILDERVMTYTTRQRERYDFTGEYVEYEHFDLKLWKKNIHRGMNENAHALYYMSEPFGEAFLKEQICYYFQRVRGIRAEKNQIIIGSGTQGLLESLARLFKQREYKILAFENPGFNIARDVFQQEGYRLCPIGLRNRVLDVQALDKTQRQICFASPSYQFPYGTLMPVNIRRELLDWAHQTDSYIIEDDYNNELRYVGKPVLSLQGMDYNERVIYMGSFSTLLLPSIRISFMVLPQSVLYEYVKANYRRTQGVSKLEQFALAHMLQKDDFGKQIRRLRKTYRQKYHFIKAVLYKYLEKDVSIEMDSAGVTCVLGRQHPFKKEKFYNLQSKYQVRCALLSEFMIEEETEYEKYIVLNYRGIGTGDIEEGVQRIEKVIRQL